MKSVIAGQVVGTGGDPRAFGEFGALRDEIGKLLHPARPDIDWVRVEQLCLTMFRQNGVELQTAVNFTLARVQLDGLAGLCEGLELISGLITRQWNELWPQQTYARVALLAWLSDRLQQAWRVLGLGYGDLAQLYRAGQALELLCNGLQAQELWHVSKLGDVRRTLQHAALRLENNLNTPQLAHQPHDPAPLPTAGPATDTVPLVYVAGAPGTVLPRIQVAAPYPRRWKAWHGFAAGVILAGITIGSAALAWKWLATQSLSQTLLSATRPLPTVLPSRQLELLELQYPPGKRAPALEPVLEGTAILLEQLNTLSPLWVHHHGDALLAQLHQFWPGNTFIDGLASGWRRQRLANASTPEELGDYLLAREHLDALAQRLNTLDEVKGRYMTISALKSAVFAIQQPLHRTVPLEELLRQYQAQHEVGQMCSPALCELIDRRFSQLLNRYALLRQPE